MNGKAERFLLAFLCSVLCFLTFFFITTKITIITYPYGIENGEGFVLYTTTLFQKGEFPYGSIAESPYWVNNYPPVYNLVCAVLSGIGFPQLAVGRAVSGAALFGIGIMLALCLYRMALPAVLSGMCGMFFIVQPFLFWSAFYRVDYLAVFFSACGAAWFLYALQKDRQWWVSILFFVLGIYTKHSALIAPCAAMATLICLRNKRWQAYVVCLVAASLLPGVILQYCTGGGFLRHLFYYTATQFSHFGISIIARNCGLLLVFTLVGGMGCVQMIRKKQFDRFSLFTALYFILNGGGLFIMFKEGSSSLYMIEYAFSAVLAGGFFMHRFKLLFPLRYANGIKLAVLIGLAVSLLWVWCIGNPSRIKVVAGFNDLLASMRIRDDEIYRKVSSSLGRVLCEDVSFPVLCGKSPEWNPFMLKQLHERGILPDSVIRLDIREKKFDMIVMEFELKPINGEVSVPGLQLLRFSSGLLNDIFSSYRIVPLESYVPVQPIPRIERVTILYPR